MKRGWFFSRLNWIIVFKSFLIFIFGVGLAGCGAEISSDSSIHSVPCTPQAPNVNIYRQTPDTWANGFFQNAPTPPSAIAPIDQQLVLLQEQQTSYASYASYQYLITEAKNWSSIQTIKLDNMSEAQIVVTFISPQLVQAVYFREVLSYRPIVANFEMNSQSALDFIAMRDELIFFVAVTTTTNNNINTASHMIDIPIDQMSIMNTESLRVIPKHDDHILDQPINSSMEPVFGYLAYPLAVVNGIN